MDKIKGYFPTGELFFMSFFTSPFALMAFALGNWGQGLALLGVGVLMALPFTYIWATYAWEHGGLRRSIRKFMWSIKDHRGRIKV